jgi:two-component system, LuxR family, response regulator FixJ
MEQRNDLTTKRHLIVIVDDDAAVRNALKFSLEIVGFIVRIYEHSEKLLSEPAFPACHCLVIDQKLPGLSGIDLIAKLRGLGVSAPAILITTHPNPALRSRAASTGIRIIEKPLLGNALLHGIHQAIARSTPPRN